MDRPIDGTMDARLYQILFLLSFLLLGLVTRDWTLHPSHIAVAIGSCCLTQFVGVSWLRRDQLDPEPWAWSDFYSPMITALGLSLLLRADHISTIGLAGMMAIGAKFLLQIQGKHIWNPANFGIVTVMLCTQDAWVSPGQWGESAWFVGLFLMTGGLVLKKVGHWETTIAFLGSYAVLEACRNLYLGWTWDVWAHRMMSGSLVMFALFMITDPRTIPNARTARLIWAFLIALVTFGLRNLLFLNTAVFWALFIIAPITILLDRWFVADRFAWGSNDPPKSPLIRGTLNLVPPSSLVPPYQGG
jgi:Na+-transporting NADH:ubiquinone oxidoreductase subunit NqrB